jgi:uncharacterized protein (TIGR02996 family)
MAPPPTTATPRPEIDLFLNEIKAHPEDDTPRMVLADWLQEHGDAALAARGELLRIQVLRHQFLENDPRQDALRRREKELLRQHLDQWVGPLMNSFTWRFERGLLHLEARGAHFFRPEVQALATPENGRWVESLALHDVSLAGAVLLDSSPFLSFIHTLDLGNNRLRPEVIAMLCASPRVANLKALFLDRNRLGPDGARALAESRNLAGLDVLDLSNNVIGDEGARHLAESPHLAHLTALWVGRNRIREEGQAILRQRFGPRVYLTERRRPESE